MSESPVGDLPAEVSDTTATDAALSAEGVRLYVQRQADVVGGGPLRVGIEQEWHTYRLSDPGRHLEMDEVIESATTGGSLPHGSRITVEPGGQVELATLPFDPWWGALEALRLDGAVMRQRLSAAHIVTVAAGLDPFRMPSRTLRHPRYVAMEEYFDNGGPAGRRMMASSASIQINIDLGPPHVANQRWTLAHRLGPALAAAFACSPSRVFRSARMANWDEIDPTRTRPALRTGDVVTDWTSYALGARLMLLHDGPDRCAAVTTPMTFADWIDRGIDGRYPTAEDLAFHCTTLFPPVRARGWLEVRWLDSLPVGVAGTAVAAVSVLLLDEEAGQQASDACASVADDWADAARQGPRDPALAQAGAACLRIAAGALGRTDAPAHYRHAVAEAAERWPARWRCPADDLEKRLRLGDKAAQLAEPLEEGQR